VSALTYAFNRHHDVSGVSGTGPVATVVEFDNGDAVLHWDTDTPSTTVFSDIRHIEALHGHGGASTLELLETDRLLKAYQQVVPWMLGARYLDRPLTCAPHPDHPDRLRLVFREQRVWAFWISLLDGALAASVQEEVNGEIEHRWTSPDGNLWLVYYTPVGSAWERHDDPEMNR
jgi:hypothetical protein